LSPRRSFSQWHQLVEGTADPWSEADMAFARLVGDTLSDVIIQFRSVRMLLAEDQLNQVRRQVEQSTLPVVIVDTTSRILKMNAAFEALLPELPRPPERVGDLLSLFGDPREVERRLDDLVVNRHAWRGEVSILGRDGVRTPLLVRADPVFTSLDRTLGFVLLFTDLTDRKAAEAARRGFQAGVMEQRPPRSGNPGSKSDLLFRTILSTITENAQLAALEIADRVDPAHMPEMLEALRASVARTAEVLRSLLSHGAPRENCLPPGGRDVSAPHDSSDQT
jgi:PAS domain-containing protein